MRLLRTCLFLALTYFTLSVTQGCHVTANTPAAATAPGYQNATDQQIGSTLAASTAFYNKLQSDSANGLFQPTSTEVQALNALQLSLAQANAVYLSFHNNTGGTLTAAQQALAQVQRDQANVQSLISSAGGNK